MTTEAETGDRLRDVAAGQLSSVEICAGPAGRHSAWSRQGSPIRAWSSSMPTPARRSAATGARS